jgi:hypothetical protein
MFWKAKVAFENIRYFGTGLVPVKDIMLLLMAPKIVQTSPCACEYSKIGS